MLNYRILRLWALLLLEVFAYSGTVAALYAGARAYHLRSPAPAAAEARLQSRAAPALWPEDAAAEDSPGQAGQTGSFMGMDDQLLMDRLRRGEAKSLRFNRGGSSVSFRVEFQDGSRAAFKPNQSNPQSVPRKEVAAYRLNRLLGLNLVPPATMRGFSREEILAKLTAESAPLRSRVENETTFEGGVAYGSLSYWVPTLIHTGLDEGEGLTRWEEWLTQGNAVPPDKITLLGQLSTLLLFDLVQNNSDRFSGGNLLGAPDGKTLFFMDNAFGFQTDGEGHLKCRTYLYRAQKFSRRFVASLRRLRREAVAAAMRAPGAPELLSEAEIDALMGRRDVALRYVDGLITKHGEEQVLVFP